MTSSHQDLPPRGGYPAIKTTRWIPSKGLTGAGVLAVVTGITTYGLYEYVTKQRQINIVREARAKERTAYLPLIQKQMIARIQAEEDREMLLDEIHAEKLRKGAVAHAHH